MDGKTAPQKLLKTMGPPRRPCWRSGLWELEYNCRDGVCAEARLEPDGMIFSTFGEALWLKGCFRVVQDGEGYGAAHLDLALSRQGGSCPP